MFCQDCALIFNVYQKSRPFIENLVTILHALRYRLNNVLVFFNIPGNDWVLMEFDQS